MCDGCGFHPYLEQGINLIIPLWQNKARGLVSQLTTQCPKFKQEEEEKKEFIHIPVHHDRVD